MDLKHVLQQVPGVNRRFIYYLESQGYISPARLQKERIARRNYSEWDLRVVRETWRYYTQGFSLQAAYDMGIKQERQLTYVGLRVGIRRRRIALRRMVRVPEVVEGAAVYADAADLLVKVSTPREAELYGALVPLLMEGGATGVPSIWRVRDRFAHAGDPASREDSASMMAYIMMKVPGTVVDEVMEVLRATEGVVEACTTYGESDIVARVVVDSQDALDRLVMDEIHRMPAVESTRTYLVIGGTYWRRPAPEAATPEE